MTIKVALTCCTSLLVPDTAKSIVPLELSKVTLALLTLMVGSSSQFVNPDEVKTLLARAGRDRRQMNKIEAKAFRGLESSRMLVEGKAC